MTYALPLGATDAHEVNAPARYLNRHGLITGSTGQGKSVSLMTMVEGLQRLGVATFVTDVKGDLSGLAIGSRPGQHGADVRPLDVYGNEGEPFRASLSAMGAPLVARALGLSDAQSGVLEVAFAVAEDDARPLHTLADLREVVAYCCDNRADVGKRYGLVTPSSVAAIGRAVLQLERSGGADFFSDQPFDLISMTEGRAVNLLHCVELYRNPKLYGAVMLWVLDTLGRDLPEIGDRELPKLCLFLDEAHWLFDQCPPAVVAMVESTVRLIRSKGVGVYFATQAPGDLPDGVARQLHMRIQHGLRAVTPLERSRVKSAAESLAPSLTFRNVDMIDKLTPGRALVSYMSETGGQTPTVLCAMRLPNCRLSPLTETERADLRARWAPVTIPDAQPAPAPRRARQPINWPLFFSRFAVAGLILNVGLIFNGHFLAGAAGLALSVFAQLAAHQCAEHAAR